MVPQADSGNTSSYAMDKPLTCIDDIIQKAGITSGDESYEEIKSGISFLLSRLLNTQHFHNQIDKSVIDVFIAEIDNKLGKQLDKILHHAEFQSMESSWRGLKFLVDRTNFRENIEISVLNASKADLEDDLNENQDVTLSGLYKHVYISEFGQFGGNPVAAVLGDYYFGPGKNDIDMMRKIARISSMAHAPFITSASPQFFNVDCFSQLPEIKDLRANFTGQKFANWRSFRESEEARSIALTLPRFLLRVPYDAEQNPVKSFLYDESVSDSHDQYLWGNTVYAFATRLADSFAKFRWCPNIIGPVSGGCVDNLPQHFYDAMGDLQIKWPSECLISDRMEYELADEGFISIITRKDSNKAVFFSANSIQKAKYFGTTKQAREAELNYRLGIQLPYMFIITRVAHYIKVLQREQLGSWKSKTDIEMELNRWLRQYISDQENPPSSVRCRKPLKAAQVEVADLEGDPGWYAITLNIVPHFKYMGASFTLSLKGRIVKPEDINK